MCDHQSSQLQQIIFEISNLATYAAISQSIINIALYFS